MQLIAGVECLFLLPSRLCPTGSFLSADPLVPGPEGLSARLISSPQVSLGTTCLSFWYRMDGPQIGKTISSSLQPK